tara:strand:- start:376 stop:1488 length:1113 start_codon:yes stop_codon:yes gene_type:complete
MQVNKPTINILKVFSAAIFIWFLVHFSNNQTYINYDSIPYTASAYLLKNNDDDKAHKYAWNLLKKKVSPTIFKDLCCSSDYRESMSQNTESFYSHMPAYSTKSGYVLIIRLVSDLLEVDEYEAMKIISQASIILISLIASLYFFNRSLFIYLGIFPILLISQILGLGRLLTPDALIALIFLISSFLLASKKTKAGFALLVSSILLRQINIIILFMMTLMLALKRERVNFLLLNLLGMLIYFLNSWYFESLGYWKHFYSNLIYLPTTFINFNPEFSFEIYFSLLKNKFLWMVSHAELNRFIGMVFFNCMIASFALARRINDFRNEILIGALLSYGVIFSYILFPVPDHRLYSGVIISSSLMLLSGLTRHSD